MRQLIRRSIRYYDVANTIRSRQECYSCLCCGKLFEDEDFPLLPAANGFLVCPECYQEQPAFSGGYLVDVLDTKGIDGYAFSHSASCILREVGYNKTDGFFLIRQELCDCGAGYEVMPLPVGFDVKDRNKLMEYEQHGSYNAKSFPGVFHPFFLFIQFGDVHTPHNTMLEKLRSRTI